MLTTTETIAASNPLAADPKKGSIAAATAASDFQSFLKLLTAQLRNQDPLSPLESTQFVEQLATFSAVEQQIETNRLLRELTGAGAASGLEGATQWIGKEVETELAIARYAGSPLEFRIAPSVLGAASEVVVRDSSGAVVFREAVSQGQARFNWDGRNTVGAAAPIGDYAVSVNYTANGEIVETRPAVTAARVVEARLSGGVLNLVLENGAVVDPAKIIAVREASSSNILPGDI